MYDSQYVFRKEHSTEIAALELIDRILTRMDNKEIYKYLLGPVKSL